MSLSGVKIIIKAYSRRTSYLVFYKYIFMNEKFDSEDMKSKIINYGAMRD